jgi:MiaB-like tRNA modifying enzyme
MNNIYIETYGCTANKSDESIIKGILSQTNFKIIDDLKKADIIIFLTCTVINTTEQKMLSRLRYFKKYNKKIIVTGCMATIQSKLIKSIIPDSIILPSYYIHHILDIINEKKIKNYKRINKTKLNKFFNEIFASISISEGCNFSCSYCITTLARGKLRSYPIDEIKKDVELALKQGCKEIQLTSQDTSSYGLNSESNLGLLLNDVCKIKGKYRIRVGMMNPYTAKKYLNPIIIGFDNNKIYKFLHLPVQSGDDEILKKMNRNYKISDFLEITTKFKKKFPNITISTDIIVGFPSETNKQFNNSINLIKKLKPDIVNITRFSARPNTIAKKLSGRLKTEDVKNRSRFLSNITKQISYENNQMHVGKIYRILTTKGGKNKTIMGRTDNYKPVIINKKVGLGEFINVQITRSTQNYLVGTII